MGAVRNPSAPRGFAAVPDRHTLARDGWQLLRAGASVDTSGGERLLAWVRSFAGPVAATPGIEVWPVSPRSTDGLASISETAGAAALHTDGQWLPEPEHGLVLLCVHPANEGGESLVLPVDAIVEELRTRAPDAERLLRRITVPFRAPATFGDKNITWHYVIAGDEMIWRADTIDYGLLGRVVEPQKVRQALSELARVVDEASPIELSLRSGDVLLVDNRRALHGRTFFSDPRRLLLRVRFNWHAAPAP